jgi:hypothetical protein
MVGSYVLQHGTQIIDDSDGWSWRWVYTNLGPRRLPTINLVRIRAEAGLKLPDRAARSCEKAE